MEENRNRNEKQVSQKADQSAENRPGMHQKKAALINDLSGLGRCSLSVQLPVLSVMQIECLLLPTCVLSNHTGYPSFYLRDLTEDLDLMMEEWKKQKVEIDAIVTGFLSSEKQIHHVLHFLDLFQKPDTLVVVDPVMGDHGKAYPTITPALQKAMRTLTDRADVLLPNLTEACLLTDTEWKEHFLRTEIEAMAIQLTEMGARKVVISGIEEGQNICDCTLEKGSQVHWIESKKSAQMRSGTGDLFCAVLTGALLHEKSLEQAARMAGDFVRKALEVTKKLHVPDEEGTAFEMVLCDLCWQCEAKGQEEGGF